MILARFWYNLVQKNPIYITYFAARKIVCMRFEQCKSTSFHIDSVESEIYADVLSVSCRR